VLLALVLVAGVLGTVRMLRAVAATSASPADSSASRERSDLVASGVGALTAMVVGLLTTFTTPGIVILPALLIGAAIAAPTRAPRTDGKLRLTAVSRTTLIVCWCFFVGTTAVGGIPLAEGVRNVEAGRSDEAEQAFTTASHFRPWDSDTASIAAQSFAAAADAGDPGAAPLAVAWARRALRSTPESLLAAKALAVGQQYSGDLVGAEKTLRRLAENHRSDSEVAHRLGGVLVLEGRADAAVPELRRASRLAPDDPDVWATLAYAYGEIGDSAAQAEAEAAARRASTLGR
jgi:hypothetical protein